MLGNGFLPMFASGGAGGITYLLRDIFTTPRATGAVNGTAPEPGPGTTRNVVDTSGTKISISGDQMVFAGGTGAWSQTGLWYSPSFTRSVGLALLQRITWTASPASQVHGWTTVADTNFTGYNNYAITQNNTTSIAARGTSAASSPKIYDISQNTEYLLGSILRTAGRFITISHGGLCRLLWVDATTTDSTLYAGSAVNATTGSYKFTEMAVLQLTGDWATDYGVAAARLAAPTTAATLTGTADAIIEATWTAVTGETLELSFRRTDDNNRWIIRCSQAGSTIKLIKVEAGAETEIGTAAQTWTNLTGYRIVAMMEAGTITLIVGTTTKITATSQAFNQTATGIKIAGFSVVENLICWPRFITCFPGIA